MAALQLPPLCLYCSFIILVTQDKCHAATGAALHSGFLSCRLTLTYSQDLAEGAAPAVVELMLSPFDFLMDPAVVRVVIVTRRYRHRQKGLRSSFYDSM